MSDTIAAVLQQMRHLRSEVHALSGGVAEVRDRTRRTETRLTRYLIAQGADVRTSRPMYNAAERTLYVPALDTSIGEAIQQVPAEDTTAPIRVVVGGRDMGTITLSHREDGHDH